MPTLKKGGFWSSYLDYYYCDDCGKWYYSDSEAELCEISHMTDKLAKMTDERDVETLLKLLEQREKLNNAVVMEIVGSLGIIGDNRATVPLIQIIEDASSSAFDSLWSMDSSVTAVEALGKIGDSRALVPIMNIFIKLDKGKSSILGWRENNYKIVANALKGISGVEAEFERLKAYDKAEEWYIFHKRHEEAATMREKKSDMAAPKTEIHGDYIDDRDTIVKDSVVSKSNIGAGGDDKLAKIKELKELLDSGAIDDDDYEKMKREIIG